MEIDLKIKPAFQIRAFYLFFIVSTNQIAVGVLNAPQNIFIATKQDAWIAILISYAYILFVILVMFYILRKYKNADIFGIQVDIFGKVIGRLLGTIYLIYFYFSFLLILLIYIEVSQIFIYPTMTSFIIALLILILVVYTVTGGLRVITGVAFLFFILTQWLLLLLYDPISRMDWDHLLPMFHTGAPELLKGIKASTPPLSGFEILFLIYPFVSNKEKAKWPVILGISYSVFILLLTTMIVIGYYSLQDIKNVEWTVLTLFKSVAYTFLERIDYIVVVEWMMLVIPTNVILMWGMTYGMKRLYNIPQRITLYIAAISILILASFIKSSHLIDRLQEIVSIVGIGLIYIYPLILLPFVVLKKKGQKKKGRGK
ncbi:GerAB/ArcD/ProY family transporter [Virgibacillus sp. W0181]|uniref:GerAB/ArcD/ProY family transporter n=1 Tax=Virgibacillus sp. W0181 TaxID=3391581 RepID=UPI003F46E43E